MRHPSSTVRAQRNLALLPPYLLPYLAYTTVASVLAGNASRELDYAVRILACGGALLWGRRLWAPLTGPRSPGGSIAIAALAGLGGAALWIGLLEPFAPPAAGPWTPGAFALRALAASLLVPLAEELAMRGWVLGLLVQWQQARAAGEPRPLEYALTRRSLHELAPGAWTGLAVAGSTALFALGHRPYEWPASLAYGLLMAALWIVRRDLLSCVVAHAVTNAALALVVLASGRWQLW